MHEPVQLSTPFAVNRDGSPLHAHPTNKRELIGLYRPGIRKKRFANV